MFDPEKLDWFNAQYLARLPVEELIRRVQPQLEAAGLWMAAYTGEKREWLGRVLRLVLPRVRRLPDVVELARPFLSDVAAYDEEAVRKHLTQADLDKHVDALVTAFSRDADPFDEPTIERVLRVVADEHRIKAAPLIHAARIAATGQAVSPGIFEVLALLGKETTLARLGRLAEYLRSGSQFSVLSSQFPEPRT